MMWQHCFSQGISRSATLVLAFLIIKKRMKLQDAIMAVKQKRSIAPNEGFMLQLIELNDDIHKLLSKSTIQKWLQTKFAVIGFHLSQWLGKNYFKTLKMLAFWRTCCIWEFSMTFIWQFHLEYFDISATLDTSSAFTLHPTLIQDIIIDHWLNSEDKLIFHKTHRIRFYVTC